MTRVGTRNAAKVLVDETDRLRLVDPAGDEQDGVVRLVVVLVERLQPIDRDILEVGPRANRRLAVVVPEEGGGHRPLEKD